MSLYFVGLLRLPERFVEQECWILDNLKVYFPEEQSGIISVDTFRASGPKSIHAAIDHFIDKTDKMIGEKQCQKEYEPVHEDILLSIRGMPARIIDLYKKSDLVSVEKINKIKQILNEG